MSADVFSPIIYGPPRTGPPYVPPVPVNPVSDEERTRRAELRRRDEADYAAWRRRRDGRSRDEVKDANDR
jgi:hypothetical protein